MLQYGGAIGGEGDYEHKGCECDICKQKAILDKYIIIVNNKLGVIAELTIDRNAYQVGTGEYQLLDNTITRKELELINLLKWLKIRGILNEENTVF